MLTIHTFGKSEGCTKCAALKRKVASVIGEDNYRGKFAVVFHDVLAEEGLVDFCRSNINPNSLPGLVIGIGELFLESVCTSEEWLERGNLLRPQAVARPVHRLRRASQRRHHNGGDTGASGHGHRRLRWRGRGQ